MEEFESLKRIVLSADQMKVFDYIILEPGVIKNDTKVEKELKFIAEKSKYNCSSQIDENLLKLMR